MDYKGSILYFANNDYLFLKDIAEPRKHKDRTMLMLQQCVEKYMKHLLKVEFSEINTTHNLSYFLNKLGGKYTFLDSYKEVIKTLRESYYDRNYEGDSYFELSDEEFQYYYDESLELIQQLSEVCNKPLDGKTKLFNLDK